MLLFVKILALVALGYFLLWRLVPKGNFVAEGLHLPIWLLQLRRLAKPVPMPNKIKYGNQYRQYLLYYPASQEVPEKKHVIIYTHGSGWLFGQPEMFKANAQWLAGQGFHAFFLTHRRLPQYHIEHLREDAALAIKAVTGEMARLGLSNKKILICGNSAGGHLSALALLDGRLLASVGLSPSLFSALACFSSPLDLSKMWDSPPLLMLTRMKDEKLYQLSNPIAYLDKAPEIPILLVHGEKDGFVETASSISFYQKLRSLGTADARLEILKDGTHLGAASWCFPGHPCNLVFKEWLEYVERQCEEK
jgi:acetyl esterase/lipase